MLPELEIPSYDYLKSSSLAGDLRREYHSLWLALKNDEGYVNATFPKRKQWREFGDRSRSEHERRSMIEHKLQTFAKQRNVEGIQLAAEAHVSLSILERYSEYLDAPGLWEQDPYDIFRGKLFPNVLEPFNGLFSREGNVTADYETKREETIDALLMLDSRKYLRDPRYVAKWAREIEKEHWLVSNEQNAFAVIGYLLDLGMQNPVCLDQFHKQGAKVEKRAQAFLNKLEKNIKSEQDPHKALSQSMFLQVCVMLALERNQPVDLHHLLAFISSPKINAERAQRALEGYEHKDAISSQLYNLTVMVDSPLEIAMGAGTKPTALAFLGMMKDDRLLTSEAADALTAPLLPYFKRLLDDPAHVAAFLKSKYQVNCPSVVQAILARGHAFTKDPICLVNICRRNEFADSLVEQLTAGLVKDDKAAFLTGLNEQAADIMVRELSISENCGVCLADLAPHSRKAAYLNDPERLLKLAMVGEFNQGSKTVGFKSGEKADWLINWVRIWVAQDKEGFLAGLDDEAGDLLARSKLDMKHVGLTVHDLRATNSNVAYTQSMADVLQI